MRHIHITLHHADADAGGFEYNANTSANAVFKVKRRMHLGNTLSTKRNVTRGACINFISIVSIYAFQMAKWRCPCHSRLIVTTCFCLAQLADCMEEGFLQDAREAQGFV